MAKKISIVIPNYNGKELLSKNLPNVLKFSEGAEVIVVDDASSDGSVDFITKNFREIKVIKQKKNLGFARSVNSGVAEAEGEFVVLLNTDVSPKEGFLNSALSCFKDEKVFAVGCADYSHESGKVVLRGRGGASFRRGFVSHFALKPKNAETLWVSGGSGIFDKKKFLELGGFDPVFAPFYWEDIDLSFRAWKKGFSCFFEEKAKVDHYHEEGAIKKTRSNLYIKSASYKNQFIFVWKNISDFYLVCLHLLWLPYHFLKALFNMDFAFFLGLIEAIFQIPQLIIGFRDSGQYELSDKEVLKKFEK